MEPFCSSSIKSRRYGRLGGVETRATDPPDRQNPVEPLFSCYALVALNLIHSMRAYHLRARLNNNDALASKSCKRGALLESLLIHA